ncbi:MAG TPA: type II toxin-antitoxin system PemK/MazF family toxin [Thermoanaerobaculia bacterium]|nr:type II toxin-antitoxin system PemK/MazF family toxin [Thermoanaerobaculia bacterium]
MAYLPDRGHVLWISLSPTAGHEQGGRRSVLVLSSALYNRRASQTPVSIHKEGKPLSPLARSCGRGESHFPSFPRFSEEGERSFPSLQDAREEGKEAFPLSPSPGKEGKRLSLLPRLATRRESGFPCLRRELGRRERGVPLFLAARKGGKATFPLSWRRGKEGKQLSLFGSRRRGG